MQPTTPDTNDQAGGRAQPDRWLPLVLRCWREVLGPGGGCLHADSHLFEAGGDSLQLARILYRLQQQANLPLLLQDAVHVMTPRRMARWCRQQAGARQFATAPGTAAPADDDREVQHYPATANQCGLWLAEQMAPDCGLYNTAVLLEFDGELDPAALEQSLRLLLLQFPVLRSRFTRHGGAAEELQADIIPVPSRVLTREESSAQSALLLLEAMAAQPFDLAQGPLWRFHLLQQGPARHVLLLCLHHSVTDGWSGRLLLQGLAQHYNALCGKGVAPVLQPDMAWQAFCEAEQQAAASLAPHPCMKYWRARLGGLPRTTTLLSAAGPRWPFAVQQECRLLPAFQMAAAAGCSSFICLLAALRQSLAALSGTQDCCLAIPVANRRTRAQERSVGYYTNLLPNYDTLVPGEAGSRLLRRLQARFLEDLDQLQVPFATLVQHLRPSLLPSGNAWCEMLLVLQNQPLAHVQFRGLRHRVRAMPPRCGQYPLQLAITRQQDQWLCSLEYAPARYDRVFARALLDQFATALARLTAQVCGDQR